MDIAPPAGYDGISSVMVVAPDNLSAANIRKGVNIAGVTGTYEGSGGSNEQFIRLCQRTITEVTADDLAGATSLGIYCFYYCTELASVVISDTVTSLGPNCFYKCTSLASIEIPNSVTVIGNSCFQHCSSLASIVIPDGVTVLNSYTFANCSSLTSVEIPNSVKTLGSSCFYYSDTLASIVIPDSVTTIENNCFYQCKKLASATMLPTAPPTLGSHAFTGASSDLVITVPKGCLDAYKAATNWSEYADKMVEASE